MQVLILFFTTILSFTPTLIFAKKAEQDVPAKGDFPLGKILSHILENGHFLKGKIDDDRSKRAFDQLIKRLDFRKQFFLQSDVDELSKKYFTQLDDQFKNGQAQVIRDSFEILEKRIKTSKEWTESYLNSVINFTPQETIETDYEKRTFAQTEAIREIEWKKSLKYQVLNEILTLEKGENSSKDDKKNVKKKVATKNTKNFSALEIQARANVLKDYKTYLDRLLGQKEVDRLSHFANAMTQAFDPHTTYLPPMEIEDFYQQMSGKLEGIGAVLSQDGPYIKVERIVPGSPSWKDKRLKEGFLILKVGQGTNQEEAVNIVGMELKDAVRLIRGPQNSKVNLTVQKPEGGQEVILITRDVVEIEEGLAKGVILEHDKIPQMKIGLISLPSFYRDFHPGAGTPVRNSTDDVAKILEEFKKLNVSGVILDLRNNGGGSLNDSVDIAGLFVESGPIVQVKDVEGKVRTLDDQNPKVEFDGPLMVLQNGFSASASEIVSGALKDYERAIIVGTEHTHGKGTVQTVVDLKTTIPSFLLSGLFGAGPEDGPSGARNAPGAIKLTIQQFFRVNGSSTQHKGVDPHIVLPDTMAFVKSGEKHLDYAIPWNEIKKANYTPWKKFKYDYPKIKQMSILRKSQAEKIKKLEEHANYLKALSEKSEKNLNYAALKASRKQEEDDLEKLSKEEEIKELKIGKIITHPLYDKKVSKQDLKRLKEAEAARQQEFTEKLKQDVYLEESLFIFQDTLKHGMINKAS